MIKTVLLLLYIYRGVPVLEQKPYNTQSECQIAGGRRAQELNKDPLFDQGIVIACVDLKLQLADK